ncbi:MAG: RDD family protein [Acidimicrobiia bacterium]
MTDIAPVPPTSPHATRRATAVRSPYARERQGLRAGFPSRLTADLIDLGIVGLIYVLGLLIVGVVKFLFNGGSFGLANPGPTTTVLAEYLIASIYLLTAYLSTGRTVGKQLMGLRVVTTRGGSLRAPAALLRTAIVISFGWVSLAWAIISRRNAAVHDILARTAVVYDWTLE